MQTKTDEVLLTYNKKKWNIKDSQIFKNYKTWLYLAIIVLIILSILLLGAAIFFLIMYFRNKSKGNSEKDLADAALVSDE